MREKEYQKFGYMPPAINVQPKRKMDDMVCGFLFGFFVAVMLCIILTCAAHDFGWFFFLWLGF
jgi:hypothetical protein